MRRTAFAVAAAAAVLAVPAVAQAHVTVQPSEAPAGGFTRLDVRVPNERDNAATNKVAVRFPPGFAEASYEPVPGWDVKVNKVKLAKPIQTDDGPVTEGVGTITWTAKDKASAIPPGAFQDFGLSVQVPGKPGDTLTFKALQTYSNGEVVRWIGPKDADQPAPTVAVVKDTSSATPAPASTPAPAQPAATTSDDSSDTLAVIALIVGALGLVAGIAGVAAARRARAAG